MQAAVSQNRYACTPSDSATMLDEDTARVSIYNFATHETAVYIVKVPREFAVVME